MTLAHARMQLKKGCAVRIVTVVLVHVLCEWADLKRSQYRGGVGD